MKGAAVFAHPDDAETSCSGRLRQAGFVNIQIIEEQVRFDKEEGVPMNVASVKVVANKPA